MNFYNVFETLFTFNASHAYCWAVVTTGISSMLPKVSLIVGWLEGWGVLVKELLS